jgi:hypothetical protein
MESWWRLLRLCHLGMMPEKRTQWKYDPSHAIALDVADICVDGRDDLPVPPGYSDVGGWRNGVGQDGLAFDRRRCNNIDRGSSGNKARTLHGIPWPGKPVAGEPLRHVSPRASPSGLDNGNGFVALWKQLWLVTDEGCYPGTLSLPTAGFLLSSPPLGPRYTTGGLLVSR